MWHKVGSPYLKNLIISLSTMVLKILILMFDEINMIELILRVTSFELMSLAFSVQFYFTLFISVFNIKRSISFALTIITA